MPKVDASASDVDTDGTIVTVDVTKLVGTTKGEVPLDRIVVVHDAGSASTFDVTLSGLSTVDDALETIAAFEDEAGVLDIAGDYPWENIDGNVYVKITPDAGADNDFRIRLYIDRGE